MPKDKSQFKLGIAIGALALASLYAWYVAIPKDQYPGIASSNGRIEAIEINIAAKSPGRLSEVYVNEGDFITAGQKLALMDTRTLNAQLSEAEAELARAKTAVSSAESNVKQRISEKEAAEFLIVQRQAELDFAQKSFDRTITLAESNSVAAEEVDSSLAKLASAKAALRRSQADVAANESAIASAETNVISSKAIVSASEAMIDRIKVEIDDCLLIAPRDGRVQYRIAQPGEVLSSGGRVLNVVDLVDVYMTFFLPTAQASRVKIGDDVRLIFDFAPSLVIPAQATFVSDVAQFTPKSVETADERQKLMFRIKAKISPDLLKKYIQSVKTGIPGVAYVRVDTNVEWPDELMVNVPDVNASK